MNTEERKVMQAALDALRMPCDRWNKVQYLKVNSTIKLLEDALAQPDTDLQLTANLLQEYGLQVLDVVAAFKKRPDQDYMLHPGDKIPESMWRKGEFTEDGYPMPTKVEFAVRGTLASLKCWHRLTQEEADDLVRFFAAKELSDEEIRKLQAQHPVENDPMPFARAVESAIVNAASQQPAPGWQLVPIEPTEAMCRAWGTATPTYPIDPDDDESIERAYADGYWKAMLKASPKYEAQK